MQSIIITKDNGQRIAALLFLPHMYQYLVIICHGFRGKKENNSKICSFAEKLNPLGFGVLAFDFSGSGESDGDFSDITLSGQVEDLSAVIDYSHKTLGRPILLLGRSFGGSTILAGALDDERVQGYVFWSTPVDIQETFTRMIREDAYEQMIRGKPVTLDDEAGEYTLKASFVQDIYNHNLVENLKQIGKRPVLIIQGQEDEVVAVYNARYMYNGLCNVEMIIVDGADHRFLDKVQMREDITVNWLCKNFVSG